MLNEVQHKILILKKPHDTTFYHFTTQLTESGINKRKLRVYFLLPHAVVTYKELETVDKRLNTNKIPLLYFETTNPYVDRI